jgi:hypothetical protein
MSSLLQHGGPTKVGKHGRGYVGLLMYRVLPSERWPDSNLGADAEPVACAHPDRESPGWRGLKSHPKLYIVWRRPVGMLGCWVQFRYNGAVHAPDLSVPIAVVELPRDAKVWGEAEVERYWHS